VIPCVHLYEAALVYKHGCEGISPLQLCLNNSTIPAMPLIRKHFPLSQSPVNSLFELHVVSVVTRYPSDRYYWYPPTATCVKDSASPLSALSLNCGLNLLSLFKLPDLPNPLPSKDSPAAVPGPLWPRSSASLLMTLTLFVSLSGVERSRNLRLLSVGFISVCGGVTFTFRAEETYCRRKGSADCTVGARISGRGCLEVYSLGEFLVRVISVAALEGARKRD
jgi:hypothetical protein